MPARRNDRNLQMDASPSQLLSKALKEPCHALGLDRRFRALCIELDIHGEDMSELVGVLIFMVVVFIGLYWAFSTGEY